MASARIPHFKHMRRNQFDRIRHKRRLAEWIGTEASRLVLEEAEVHELSKSPNSATIVSNLPTPEPD